MKIEVMTEYPIKPKLWNYEAIKVIYSPFNVDFSNLWTAEELIDYILTEDRDVETILKNFRAFKCLSYGTKVQLIGERFPKATTHIFTQCEPKMILKNSYKYVLSF